MEYISLLNAEIYEPIYAYVIRPMLNVITCL